MDPDTLRDEAARLRERAEEIAEENPAASECHELRADWCEYLARKREEEQG
jgi:hypothetical protein